MRRLRLRATASPRRSRRWLAYNLGNFLLTLALPQAVEHWSLTTLREKLIKIGVKVVRHGRYVTFQLAAAGPLAAMTRPHAKTMLGTCRTVPQFHEN